MPFNRYFHSILIGILAIIVIVAGLSGAYYMAKFPLGKGVSSFINIQNTSIKEARYWVPQCAGVQCTLCPWRCFLPEGQIGRCKVRANVGNKLMTLVYQKPVAVHIDPIEKKPVFHLLPGSWIYSLATMGCNLKCAFCQNWEISQGYPMNAEDETLIPKRINIVGYQGSQAMASLEQETVRTLSPQEVVQAALDTKCQSIAYTYSEPIVFFEYVMDIAKLAKKRGLKNVLVSAGTIEPEPLAELAPYFDVIKIDLKGFNEKFYRDVVGGELKFVLRTLEELARLKVLTEIVNLVVPTMNDDEKEIRAMARWIKTHCGASTPVFFSKFTPNYRLQNIPATPISTLERARAIAQEEGLEYVYIGNVPGHPAESTYCPRCKQVLIQRYDYQIIANNLTKDSRCPHDGTKIPGVWQ